MRIYRIAPEAYLENYSGLGASYANGARWNRPGQPVLYFALSASTALLELANYIPSPRLIPATFRLGIFELPESAPVDELDDADLPPDWAAFPYPASTQSIGADWLAKGEALALLVPSAAVPRGLERSAVVNPRHSDCGEITLIDSTDDLYNKRTFGGDSN